MSRSICAALAAVLLASPARSEVASLRLASLFSDNVVLQRDQPVRIWGESVAGDQVVVKFADQEKATRADIDGGWSVVLDPLGTSSLGRELVVRSGATGQVVHAADVLVGDVWLCSGQSNMHFRMAKVANAERESAAASRSAIRFFTVGEQFSQSSRESLKGSWVKVSPATVASCSAVAYFFGKEVHKRVGVPIGLLVSSVGGTRIESWMRPETLTSTGVSTQLVEKWKGVTADEFENLDVAYRVFQHQRDRVHAHTIRAARLAGEKPPAAPVRPEMRCHDCPSALHHGMIAPLQPFAIRGVIWYQGESNAGQAAAYEKLLPAMITDWRRVWGKELPFLFVQLAPHQSIHPAFRESQLRIWRRTPHTAMAVTTDVGDWSNIHPTNKQPVGQRLALAAMALSYGGENEFSGPVFESLKIEKDRAVVSFSHVGSGLTQHGTPVRGFKIAGADGEFVPAHAEIEGATIVATSQQVAHPVAVRYNWSKAPEGNLFNEEGLPAVPFRSDAPTSSAYPE